MLDQTHGTWGERLKTFEWSGGLVTLLFLKSGNRCSWHKHNTTWNKFTLCKGKVGIKTGRGYETILMNEKESFTAEPGIYHEFRVYEDSILEEIAYVVYDPNDIQRENIGGILETNEDLYCKCNSLTSGINRDMIDMWVLPDGRCANCRKLRKK